jgi:hypothetical protein
MFKEGALADSIKIADAYCMEPKLLDSLVDQIRRRRREWTREGAEDAVARNITAARKRDLKEKTLGQGGLGGVRNLDEKKNDAMRDLDIVLKRIETGKFGTCEQCGRPIEDKRLSANPTLVLCSACGAQEEHKAYRR